MKPKTAVEWLESKIKTSKYFYKLMEEIQSKSTIVEPNIFEKAKQIEREQHGKTWDAAIKAHDVRGHVHSRSWSDFDDYEVGS